MRNIDKTNAIIAALVWLIALVVYYITKAPTLSFWDCGEFIASAYILGVPHPPGTPLYILLGRVFSILPIDPDYAVRVNLLSVVSSSITALFCYLIAVRLLRAWLHEVRTLFSQCLMYGGGVAAALFVAFSLTHWNNSVEAEVYGLAMLIMTAIIWLALVYTEHAGKPFGGQIIALVFFLAFLGIGVHMSTYLIMPVIGLFFVVRKQAPKVIWFVLAVFFVVELYLIFALSSRPDEIPYYIPVTIVFVFYLFYIFSFERVPRLSFLTAVGLGFSLLPMAAVLVNLFASANGYTPPVGESTVASLGTIGLLILVAFAMVAAYIVFKSWREGGDPDSPARHNLISGVFVITAVLMTVALNVFKGYAPFLVLTAALVLILALVVRRHIHWPILVAFLSVSLIIIGLREFAIGLAAGIVVELILGLWFKMRGWRIGLVIILMAVIGFSVHGYIPVRSSLHPMINQNNTHESLRATVDFIERKQYGQMSMTERMFTRRAEWENQFGKYQRMGFWYFFEQQYGLTGPKFVILFLLGVFGIWEMIRRKPKLGLPLLIMLLVTSVGLVLYMNFADGQRQNPVTGADYIEVRDRHYFFTPAFILFGLAIGTGIAIACQYLADSVRKFSPGPRKIATYSSLVLLLLPIVPFARNYELADRTGDFMPYDYAWNILSSAEENSVLFTVGDNDTFPIWCIQEVYGVRNDVKLVNLSLANTHWYTKQVRDYLDIDLGWTDQQINQLRFYRNREGTLFQIRDQVIDAIINRSGLPVGFSVTTSQGTRRYQGQPLDRLLRLYGMTWRLQAEPVPPGQPAVDYCYEYYTDTLRFRTRGIADESVHKTETAERLTRNYGNGFTVTADSLVRAGEFERAVTLLERAAHDIPYATEPAHFLGALYADLGRLDELTNLMVSNKYVDKNHLTLLLALGERKLGHNEEAEAILDRLLKANPTDEHAFRELLKWAFEARDENRMAELMTVWLRHNPDDNQVKQMLQELQQFGLPAEDPDG